MPAAAAFPSVVKRKNGKKVVIWRWYEKGQDGKSRERWKTLGLASRIKSDAAAQEEAERLGLGRPIEEGPRTLLHSGQLPRLSPKVGQTAMGGPSLGPSKGRGRRELAVNFEKRRWHSPSRWFEKENQGPDASSIRARNPL